MPAINVVVELFYSAAWHVVPAYTRDPIQITRGRPNEAQQAPPSTASLSLDNRTGAYSPRNPNSALYGLIGRNTPIRITADSSVRFVGEVESWPQRSNVKGSDVWTPITATGILRRLNAPGTTRPALSALYRAVTGSATAPLAYWPMESYQTETTAGDSLPSPIAGVGPLTQEVRGASFGQGNVGPGSAPVVDFRTGGTLVADIPNDGNFVATNGYTVEWVARFDNNSSPSFPGLAVNWLTPGTAQPELWRTDYGNYFDVVFGTQGHTNQGSVFDTSNASVYTGLPHHYRITAVQSGANIVIKAYIDGVQVGTGDDFGGGAATVTGTLNRPTKVWVSQGNSGEALEDMAQLGHVTIWHGTTPPVDTVTAFQAYVGETVEERIDRLCDEDGITVSFFGASLSVPLMGAQRVAPWLDLVYDAVAVDGGILFDTRGSLGLRYYQRAYLHNAATALALDYTAGGEVAPPLDPVEDTDATGNDITVTRYGGTGARVVQETGPLNVQEPSDDPDGVGRYQKDYTLVLYDDAQCASAASWIRHLGTWDEARFPIVNVDLTAMAVDGKTALITSARALDIGDRFTIARPPSWLPPETIVLLAQGFTETIESHRWTIAINATPALPYEVLALETGSGNRSRIPAARGETTTNEVMDATETGMDIISTTQRWIDSATYAAQFPFDVMVNGERMTVTALSGTGLTQTMTVTRSVNAVSKTHPTGVEVQLFHPPVIAR